MNLLRKGKDSTIKNVETVHYEFVYWNNPRLKSGVINKLQGFVTI